MGLLTLIRDANGGSRSFDKMTGDVREVLDEEIARVDSICNEREQREGVQRRIDGMFYDGALHISDCTQALLRISESLGSDFGLIENDKIPSARELLSEIEIDWDRRLVVDAFLRVCEKTGMCARTEG